jgi:hypothetical protein
MKQHKLVLSFASVREKLRNSFTHKLEKIVTSGGGMRAVE